MRGIMIMSAMTALVSRMMALIRPMKQSKKKLKYKNTLKARKFSSANIVDFRFRNMYLAVSLFTSIFTASTATNGITVNIICLNVFDE